MAERLPVMIAVRETTIGGYLLRIVTLDDGRHVIPAEYMTPFVEALHAGRLTPEHAEQAMKFVRGTH